MVFKKCSKEEELSALWSEEFRGLSVTGPWREVVVNMPLIKFQPAGMCLALSEKRGWLCTTGRTEWFNQPSLWTKNSPLPVAAYERRPTGLRPSGRDNNSSGCQCCCWTFPRKLLSVGLSTPSREKYFAFLRRVLLSYFSVLYSCW